MFKKPFGPKRFGGRDERGGGFGGGRGGFNKGGFGGGRGGFNKGGFGGGPRQSFPSQMHPATCAECSASCEVPFKPNGRKPILCSNCFKKDGDAPRFERRERPSFGDSRPPRGEGGGITAEQFAILNEKLDTIMELLNDE